MGTNYFALAKSDPKDLEYVLRSGVPPELEGLVGWEFKGYNLPPITRILGFRKFKKGFFLEPGQSPEAGEISGYNLPVVQNRLEDPWMAKPNEAEPRRYAFYRVYKVRASEVDSLYPNALLLNYGLGNNPIWHPARLLRDYLVQVEADNLDLLLGKAYVAIGSARLFPSFFVLERDREVNRTAESGCGGSCPAGGADRIDGPPPGG